MKVKNILKFGIFLFLASGFIWSCGDDETETPGGMLDLPLAAFTTTENELMVQFNNNSTNATVYAWDFGDGSGTSTDENPSYTYDAAGTYEVTLEASNADGEMDALSVTLTLASANEKLDLLVGTEGKTWKLLREGTAMLLAADPEFSQIFWPGSSNNGERPCLYDDSFTFSNDGTFAFDDAGSFWAEFEVFFNIEGCDQNTKDEACFEAIPSNMLNECGDDVSAWLSNDTHSFTFDTDNNTITLEGLGAWFGIPKLGTSGQTIVPLNEVTFNATLVDGGSSAVDTMFANFNYDGAFWAFTYVSYDNPNDEPALIETFNPPACEPLASAAVTELSHTFETATSSVLLNEIIESASDIEYGATDPADAAATPVGRFIRTGAQFQELQFRLNPENAVDFSNMSTVSLEVYLPSSNIYGPEALTQNVFVGFGATTCPPLWFMDHHQYEATELALDEWVTVTFELDSPTFVAQPGNGATVFDRNDLDMVFIQIGGGNHFQAGDFFVRNFLIQ